MKILIVHGPNLNLLGSRELAVYGSATLEELNAAIAATAKDLGIDIEIHQTAHEGRIIELLHGGIDDCAGAVVNPGAYAHTSRAIADAIRAVPYPVIEVHLSNIHARDSWRHRTVTGEAAVGVIAGLGSESYRAALRALQAMAES